MQGPCGQISKAAKSLTYHYLAYRQKTKFYGRCMMNDAKWHIFWWRMEERLQQSIQGSCSVVTDEMKGKIVVKMQKDKKA